MPIEWLSRVARILAGHSAETAGRAALWEGNGWLHPGGSSVVTFRASDDGAGSETEPQSGPDQSLPFDPGEWEDRKLELPNRAYFVFDLDLKRLTDPAWAEDSGWGWGTSFWEDTPNLLWPNDRSWFLVSEIDFDSTVIGCSAAVAAELLADGVLETALIPEGASLSFEGDEVNR
jgi:hypothetical protein